MSWFFRKLKGGIRCLKEHGLGYTMKLFLKKATKKVLSSINKAFQSISKRLALGFIEIIKVKTYIKDELYGHVYFVFLFGKQIYPRKRQHKTNAWVDPDQPVMYFKINRMSEYARPCVQHWVNIAYHMRADYYFICDNIQLQYHLLRTTSFPGSDIKFIPSMRKPLYGVCRNIATSYWENATYAHLTPFYHAKNIAIKKYWTIDADDTMLCLKHRKVAEALKLVQSMADSNEFSVISLDMWRSRTLERHWSWGVAYVNDNVNFIDIFEGNPDSAWMKNYQEFDVNFNLDWFFTYLKDHKGISVESFYLEDTYFIHWGSFLRQPVGSAVFFWSNGKLFFPILEHLFCNENLGRINIADCRKISCGTTLEESMEFLQNEVPRIKWYPPQLRKLNNVQEFCRQEKSLENL